MAVMVFVARPAYIYGLNYKPFGKGGFSEVKNRLLVVFLSTESVDSDIWRKYCHLIASDLGMPCVTAEHHDALWEAVAALPSFHQKLGFPKMGRWFSWNDSCHAQMPEFYATKMLLEHHLNNVKDPDLADAHTFDIDRAALAAVGKNPTAAAELAARKGLAGGMALAYKLMSSSLHQHVKILYTVSNPCWDWYTDQVESVKTPERPRLKAGDLQRKSYYGLLGAYIYIYIIIA